MTPLKFQTCHPLPPENSEWRSLYFIDNDSGYAFLRCKFQLAASNPVVRIQTDEGRREAAPIDPLPSQ